MNVSGFLNTHVLARGLSLGRHSEMMSAACTHLEAKASKKGKTSLLDNSTVATYNSEEWLPRAKPLAKS